MGGAELESVPDADVVPLREAEILLAAHEPTSGNSARTASSVPSRGAVVHDHDSQRRMLHGLQGPQAPERVIAAVPREHDDRDVVHLSGEAPLRGRSRSVKEGGSVKGVEHANAGAALAQTVDDA